MRINKIQQIPFTNCIRIHLKDKTRGNDTPMDKIISVVCENKATYLIGEDIFILNSSNEIKEGLDSVKISYKEVSDEDPYKK